MEFRTLGGLEVWHAERPVPIKGAVQRSVLTLLLLNPNATVRTEDLIDEVWGATPPHTASKMIQNAVSNLRKSGMAKVLATRAGGYMLRVDPEQIDAHRFERLVQRAREALEARTPELAEQLIGEANTLWRGAPLSDSAPGELALTEIARLEELRLAATECEIEAGLALGRHRELASTLETLVGRHPLREGFRLQLILALYRSARQAEALAAYQSARTYLREELGLHPGRALQRLEQAILIQDQALELPDADRASTTGALRKTLTVLHADLVRDGRELDPETLLALTERIDALVLGAIAAHGGKLAPSAGDTYVAVFGLPTLAENDTLRAVRATIDVREALAGLNDSLERDWGVRYVLRAGLATGKALVDLVEGAEATGEVFATAARLARSARPGEVLLGPSTRHTLKDAVEVDRVAELSEGDEAPAAWRLLGVRAIPVRAQRWLDGPIVGRNWELTQLRHVFERVMHGRTSYLVPVLGPAGIGKSRLVNEFLTEISEAATVLTGRCPSYGVGVTFWPLAAIVREAAGATTRAAIAALLGDELEVDEIASRIAAAVGDEETAGSAYDLFWATGRLFVAQARSRPLVVVLDDLQWAEPMLLDLLEQLVDATRDAPVMLVCIARSELLDTRPVWGGGKLNAATIHLEPLSQPECELLVSHHGAGLTPTVAARTAEAAEGNPLFLEQLVAMALEEGAGADQVAIPPTIEALLAARLDRLHEGERTALERASVVGKEFSLSEVAALSPEPERDGLRERLQILVRRELLAQTAPPRRGDAGFRFRHGLMRDAAYDAMPKADRATKHEVLARFLEARPDHVRGSAEVLGFHLEQAHRYRVELGEAGDNVRELAVEASDRLGAAGLRAYARDDVHGAVALLERSASLAGVGSATRLKLLPDLAEAVRESGDYAHAEALVAEAIDGAGRAGDLPLEEYARLIRLRMRVQTDPSLGADDLVAGARRALDVFRADDDARSLAKAWELLAWGQWLECHAEATEEALAHSLAYARRAADGRTIAQSLQLTLGAAVFGPRAVPDAIALCEEILEDGGAQKRVAGSALRALAALNAMTGDFDEARALLGRFSSIVDDIGLGVTSASAAETYAEVELRAGDARAAEQRLRPAYDQLAAMGESSTSANLAALLAQALHAQGRDDEAVAVSDVVAAKDDVSACVHLLIARSLALAAVGGNDDEAERRAREAVARAQKTDFLAMRADSLRGLAEVVGRLGRHAEAKRLLGRALELYRRKQLTVAIDQTEELLTGPSIPPEGGLS